MSSHNVAEEVLPSEEELPPLKAEELPPSEEGEELPPSSEESLGGTTYFYMFYLFFKVGKTDPLYEQKNPNSIATSL